MPGTTSTDERIDAVCHHFERDWLAGLEPRIEDALLEIDSADRPALFLELLAIEVELRRTWGEAPDPDEYLARFPDWSKEIPRILNTVPDAPSPDSSWRAETANGKATPAGQRFRILRPLAKGGLGEVYVGWDEQLGREVALKLMKKRLVDDASARARFEQEGRITGRLEHPGVVPVYSATRGSVGSPFYVMRLISGTTLTEAISQFHAAHPWHRGSSRGESRLSLHRLIRQLVSVCSTVEFAHCRGIVHRDLKPDNIMIGDHGEVLVIDWGLARSRSEPAPDDERTPLEADPLADSIWGGTLFYMSPEQSNRRSDLLGPRSDVYSLGAILYHILTGEPPHYRSAKDSDDPDQTLTRIQRGVAPRPRAIQPRIPRDLEAVCLKAMEPGLELRHASAGRLGDDLERWLAGEPVTAWVEPWTWRLGRWCQVRRGLLAAGAAAVLLAASGLAAWGWHELELDRLEFNLALATLSVASPDRVHEVLQSLRAHLSQSLPTLHAMFNSDDPRQRRLAALALVAYDTQYIPAIEEWMLDSTLNEIEPLAVELRSSPEVEHVRERFWRIATDSNPSVSPARTLRAMVSLFHLGLPKTNGSVERSWDELAGQFRDAFIHATVEELNYIRDRFRPIAPHLLPPMVENVRARLPHVAPGPLDSIGDVLLAWSNRTDGFDALVKALPSLRGKAFRDAILRVRKAPKQLEQVRTTLLQYLEERPSGRDKWAWRFRQAGVTASLLHLGEPVPEPAWKLLGRQAVPSVRTLAIARLGATQADPQALHRRLAAATDPWERQALILALGEIKWSQDEMWLAALDRDLAPILAMHPTEPDSGAHSAALWTIRKWHRYSPWRRFEKDHPREEPGLERGWYLGPEGQYFAIVRSAPPLPQGRGRVDHPFAIGVFEVSRDHQDRYSNKPESPDFNAAEMPWTNVDVYKAMEFCNWLTKRAGLPDDQLCYPEPIGPDMVLPADFLQRTGYRLPTEVEWEVAARAGSEGDRFFGVEDDEPEARNHALDLYYAQRFKLGRVGQHWPNPLGLFDVYGNAAEWCHAGGDPGGHPPKIVHRGGAYSTIPERLSSIYRVEVFSYPQKDPRVGFRLARTLGSAFAPGK